MPRTLLARTPANTRPLSARKTWSAWVRTTIDLDDDLTEKLRRLAHEQGTRSRRRAMIIPDVNLLVYAHNSAAPLHAASRRWWEDSINREQPVGLPWVVALGFIRLVTHPSVLSEPLSALDALAHVRTWVAQSSVDILEPGPGQLKIVETLFAPLR